MSDFFGHIYPYRRHIDDQQYSLAIRGALELLESFRSSAPLSTLTNIKEARSTCWDMQPSHRTTIPLRVFF